MSFKTLVISKYLVAEAFTKERVENFSASLEKKYDLKALELTLAISSSKDPQLKLHAIVLPKEKRGTGIGSKVMNEIIDFADQYNKIIVLTPSKDFGATSVSRLKRFYSGFGFLKNTGKSKDFTFSEAMIRYPKGKTRSKYLDEYLKEKENG
jgi:predicted GNAT family N-acyltransferase